MLRRAGREPGNLIVGIDADASSMQASSRRGAAKASRNGRPNALFVVSAAENLGKLAGCADEVTVHFPWGSLLRGSIGSDPAVLASIAAAMKPGASMSVLFSLTDRDGLAEPTLTDLQRVYVASSLVIESFEPLTEADVQASGSSWGRRLGVGRLRPGWRLVARKTFQGGSVPIRATSRPVS